MPRDVRLPPAAGGATPVISSKHKTPATLKAGAQVLGRQLSLMQDATQRLCAISATHLETCGEQLDLAKGSYSAASALAAENSGGSEDVRKHEIVIQFQMKDLHDKVDFALQQILGVKEHATTMYHALQDQLQQQQHAIATAERALPRDSAPSPGRSEETENLKERDRVAKMELHVQDVERERDLLEKSIASEKEARAKEVEELERKIAEHIARAAAEERERCELESRLAKLGDDMSDAVHKAARSEERLEQEQARARERERDWELRQVKLEQDAAAAAAAVAAAAAADVQVKEVEVVREVEKVVEKIIEVEKPVEVVKKVIVERLVEIVKEVERAGTAREEEKMMWLAGEKVKWQAEYDELQRRGRQEMRVEQERQEREMEDRRREEARREREQARKRQVEFDRIGREREPIMEGQQERFRKQVERQRQQRQEQEQAAAAMMHMWSQLELVDARIEDTVEALWPLSNELAWTARELQHDSQGLVESLDGLSQHLKNTHLDLCFVHHDIERRASGLPGEGSSSTAWSSANPRDGRPPLPPKAGSRCSGGGGNGFVEELALTPRSARSLAGSLSEGVTGAISRLASPRNAPGPLEKVSREWADMIQCILERQSLFLPPSTSTAASIPSTTSSAPDQASEAVSSVTVTTDTPADGARGRDDAGIGSGGGEREPARQVEAAPMSPRSLALHWLTEPSADVSKSQLQVKSRVKNDVTKLRNGY